MDLSIYFTFEKMAYVYRTPPASPNRKNRKMMCPWAPNREGNSNEVIHIRFPVIYRENEFSTPLKRRRVNTAAPGPPIKSQKRSLLQTNLDNFRQQLFRPNFSASLRKRIKEERRKIIKSSEYPGAPMKSEAKRKSNERDLKPVKKRLFENKEISPYSRTLTK